MTIKDLARLSGYSLGTVSRVLNHQPNVSRRAQEKILAIAQEYGFELNSNAKNLKQQRSNSLLVIVKGRANELFFRIIERIQTLTADQDFPLLIDYIDEDENEVRRAISLCREKKPRGILFCGGIRDNFIRDFAGIEVPSVLVTNSAEGLSYPNLSSVTTDDAGAAYSAVSYLISLGHKDIAVIGGDPRKSEISQKRCEGCAQAFSEHHLRQYGYVSARFSFQDGYGAMEQILEKKESGYPSAVFLMADVMAIGAIRCIHNHGLRVPEDISVIGFDGLPVGQYIIPRLTTIHQSVDRIAEECLRVLMEALEGGSSQHITVPYVLRENESAVRANERAAKG